MRGSVWKRERERERERESRLLPCVLYYFRVQCVVRYHCPTNNNADSNTVFVVACCCTLCSIISGMDEGEVQNTLARVNGVQAILMLPLQAATGPVLTRFGVLHGLGTVPMATVLFGLLTGLAPGAYSLIVARSL